MDAQHKSCRNHRILLVCVLTDTDKITQVESSLQVKGRSDDVEAEETWAGQVEVGVGEEEVELADGTHAKVGHADNLHDCVSVGADVAGVVVEAVGVGADAMGVAVDAVGVAWKGPAEVNVEATWVLTWKALDLYQNCFLYTDTAEGGALSCKWVLPVFRDRAPDRVRPIRRP